MHFYHTSGFLHSICATAQNRKYTILYEPHLWACSACSLLSVTNSLPLHSLALVWTYPNFPASSSSCCWGNKQCHRTVYSISDWGSGKNWLHARFQKAYRKVKRKKDTILSHHCTCTGIDCNLKVVKVWLRLTSFRLELQYSRNKPLPLIPL